jgi:dTMP kinase
VIIVPRKRGRLIAIEGIDQAGKRTQAHLLAANLRIRGRRVSVWDFPDYRTPLGKQLKAYLGGKIRLDVRSVHLLYAANKWEVAAELTRKLGRGEFLIVNRYTPSNIAYGMAHGLPASWLGSLEEGLPKPDRVVILDISPRTSLWRKRKDRDVHEGNLAYLNRVRREYLHIAKRYGWKIVDGGGDPETVRRMVWARVSSIIR